MPYKPGDFFLGVIDFFGIFVPGAVLMYLHGDRLVALFGGQQLLDSQVSRWVGFLIGAYVLGQILFGVTTPLDKLSKFYPPESKDAYYQQVRNRIKLPRKLKPKGRTAAFHRAYSYVRLHGATAITEIERQTAEYKLFRSLVLVFLLDFPLVAWTNGSLDWPRAVAMIILLAFALWRFLYVLNWARRLTFEFYALLEEKAAADKA